MRRRPEVLLPVLFWVFLILPLLPARAQDVQDTTDIILPVIVVTPRRVPLSLDKISEQVAVITDDEIAATPARTVAEVLKYIPGVDIDTERSFGRPTSVSIHGSDSRQVRIMVDGIPFNTQSSGQVNPSQFPVEIVQRIEIIKGPASHLWGSSLGGLINIVTKDTGSFAVPEGRLTTQYAEFDTQKQTAEISARYGSLGYYAFGSYFESGGAGPREDVLQKQGLLKFSFDPDDRNIFSALFGYGGADIHSGVFPDGLYQAQPYRSRYGKLGWRFGQDDTVVQADLKHSRQEIVTRTFLSEDAPDPAAEIVSKDLLYQLSLVASQQICEDDLFVFGADLDWDTVKSNTYLSQAESVAIQAPFASYTHKAGEFDLNAGVRYDHNSEFGEEFSPSAGAVYHPGGEQDTRIYISAARSFNAPPLLWRFNDAALLGVAPNPFIGAERAWTTQAGLSRRWQGGSSAEILYYYARLKDALSMAENADGLLIMQNFEEFRRQGVEFNGRLQLSRYLSCFAAAAFNDIRDMQTGQVVQGGAKPRQRYEGGFEIAGSSGFRCLLYGYYYYWNEPPSSQPNDRKVILDVKISQTIRQVTVFLNVYNLGGSRYWRDYYFPTPRRYVEGGVAFSW